MGMMPKDKKNNDLSKRLSIIANVLLTCVLILAAVGVLTYKKSKDGEIARLNKLIELTEENNIIIPVNDFMEYATRYGLMTQFSQRYFPEKHVYVGYHGIEFSEINESLKTNPLNKEENTFYEEGRLYYQEGAYRSLTGIDVSVHQGYIDWAKVKEDGIDFAYIRVGYRGYSEGKMYIDDYYYSNMRQTAKVGMPVGVYFFSGAINEKEAIAEADYVLSHIKGYKVDYPIAFDMEDISASNNRMKNLSQDEKTKIAIAFCQRINDAGYKTVIYGNAKWLLESLHYPEIAQYGIWYANWDFYHWPYELLMHQYTSSGTVDGIRGRVDMNIGFFNYQE